MENHRGGKEGGVIEHYTPAPAEQTSPFPNGAKPVHGAPEVTGVKDDASPADNIVASVEDIEASRRGWFAYVKTRDFYIVLLLGCVIS